MSIKKKHSGETFYVVLKRKTVQIVRISRKLKKQVYYVELTNKGRHEKNFVQSVNFVT